MSTDREQQTGANTAGQSALIEPLGGKRYKVLLEKCLGIFDGARGPIPPFSNFDITNPKLRSRYEVREFIIPANDEEEIKQHLAEAIELELPNVVGYRLRSIELLPPNED